MSKNNSKSLSSLRQKLRKYNKEFELDIAKFRENPDQAEDEEDEEKGNSDIL
jgi:Eukaryotic translation initiation factor 3 subunit 8 N-terminus.